jgi:hypothetical protein
MHDMPTIPPWKTPKNIAEALDDGDGFWEDDRWSPIMLTAMSGTEYEGREIPVAWQIEFDPSEAANAKLNDMGVEPNGYGWGDYIQTAIRQTNPGLADRLYLSDCEIATCVIWVETEEDCRELLETAWKLIREA